MNKSPKFRLGDIVCTKGNIDSVMYGQSFLRMLVISRRVETREGFSYSFESDYGEVGEEYLVVGRAALSSLELRILNDKVKDNV